MIPRNFGKAFYFLPRRPVRKLGVNHQTPSEPRSLGIGQPFQRLKKILVPPTPPPSNYPSRLGSVLTYPRHGIDKWESAVMDGFIVGIE